MLQFEVLKEFNPIGKGLNNYFLSIQIFKVQVVINATKPVLHRAYIHSVDIGIPQSMRSQALKVSETVYLMLTVGGGELQ